MPFPLALMSLAHLGMIVLLVLGFGFVIFWHELGHFLAAKWVGIKVDQFAVGFGNALFSWRKGIGFRFGNTQKDYRERAERHLLARRPSSPGDERPEFSETEIGMAATEIGLGDTEYRLNWIPLGGYVKMLGQDDLKPDAVAEDPRAYNKKSISARMLVISAGVIMNIILAAIGFMVLFLYGFNVPPAWAGHVVPGSPAQIAGLEVGDHIITFDGKKQEDFTKITLNTALTKPGEQVTMEIERYEPDPKNPGHYAWMPHTLKVTPARAPGDKGFVQIGFSAPAFLEGPKIEGTDKQDDAKILQQNPPDVLIVRPGDVITKVNGVAVERTDYAKFNKFIQEAHGSPLTLTVRGPDGKERTEKLQPHFEEPFDGTFNLAGLVPRTTIAQIMDNSPVIGKIHPLDVVEAMIDHDTLSNPSRAKLMAQLKLAGEGGHTFTLKVLRGKEEIPVPDLKATVKVGDDRKGLGVVLMLDEQHAIIADVLPDSPAEQAGLKPGDQLTTPDGTELNWYDVQRLLAANVGPNSDSATAKLMYVRNKGDKPQAVTLKLDKAQLDSLKQIRYYAPFLTLAEYVEPRKTSDPLLAAKWGVTETRDFMLQFYVTLRRMAERSVSPANMMGPVGIFYAGGKFAFRGLDWLLWFLAMISANLAVVNFLPIPVVDGGQFMFLIFEKIKGKPLSPRSMAIAQYCGLAFLAAVVLYVTYHDIVRFF
jgi:regulator of sigma E protease